MLTTKPNIHIMKKFLDKNYMKKFLVRNKKKFIPTLATVDYLAAERIILLSAESFLIKYDADITHQNGHHEYSLILRGNRIPSEAAHIWKYIYNKSAKETRNIVPRPIHYFKKERFMLYREMRGKTLRDYDQDYATLKKITPYIAKNLAWWHALPLPKFVKKKTEAQERAYWLSVKRKITTYLPHKPAYFNSELDAIAETLKRHRITALRGICHNDFQASNLIYDNRLQRVGIIDFGSVTICSPAIDVATYLVHLAVMTNHHLSPYQVENLQRLFIAYYRGTAKKKLWKDIVASLPLYEARIAADIIATTAVALKHTKNPYRKIIPRVLIPVVKEKLRIHKNTKRAMSTLTVRLKPYHGKLH